MRYQLFTASLMANRAKTKALGAPNAPVRAPSPPHAREQASRRLFWQEINAELEKRGHDEAMAGEIASILEIKPRPTPLIVAAKIIWDRGRHV